MRTASMTTPIGFNRSRDGLANYLPHAVIVALLFALLIVASQGSAPAPVVNTSLTHLGQH